MAKAFFEQGVYEFAVKGGRFESGAIHKDHTILASNGCPMVVALYDPTVVDGRIQFIPWHSVVSYRKVG